MKENTGLRDQFTRSQDESRQIAQKLSRFQTGSQLFGLYRGICEDNLDPHSQRRIKVRIVEFHGVNPNFRSEALEQIDVERGLTTEDIPWALPCLPPSHTNVPAIGDQVWVEFEKGDVEAPVWFGIYPFAPEKIFRPPQKPPEPSAIIPSPESFITKGPRLVEYWKGVRGMSRTICRDDVYPTNLAGNRALIPVSDKTADKVPNSYGWKWPRGTLVDVIEEEGKTKIVIMDINRNIIKIETENGILTSPKYKNGEVIRQATTNPTNIITLYAGKLQDHLAHDGEQPGAPVEVETTLAELRLIGEKRVLIQSDGILDVFVKDNATVTINGDAKIGVNGDVDLTVEGDLNQKIGGDYKLDVAGDFKTKVGGDISREATGSIDDKATINMTLAANLELTISSMLKLTLACDLQLVVSCLVNLYVLAGVLLDVYSYGEAFVPPSPEGSNTPFPFDLAQPSVVVAVSPSVPSVPDIPPPPIPEEVQQTCVGTGTDVTIVPPLVRD